MVQFILLLAVAVRTLLSRKNKNVGQKNAVPSNLLFISHDGRQLLLTLRHSNVVCLEISRSRGDDKLVREGACTMCIS